MTKRAYKYRFYPTPVQKQFLAQTFGCVRYVWNWALRYRTDAYYERGERLFYVDMSAKLTALKKAPETCWLSDVSSVPLQQTLRHQDQAFRNFFEGRAGYPVFKKKRNQKSAIYASTAFSWNGQDLKLAKMTEPLDIRWSRSFKGNPSTVVVSKDSANRYFVSLLIEEEIKPFKISPNTIGIDLGLADTVITSDGHRFGNPQFFRKAEQRLAKAQRNLAKKQKGSKNREKARLKVARIHARIKDRRNDFLHKLSTALICENQVICAESLNVKGMLRNHHLAKSISDVGWGEFVRQLAYKAEWYGRDFVQIDTNSIRAASGVISAATLSDRSLFPCGRGLAMNATQSTTAT